MLDEIRRFSGGDTFRFISPEHAKVIKSATPQARQFIFDEQSSAIMADFIQKSPDLLFKNEQFAIPQFPTCYYEFDAETFLKAMGKPTTGAGDAGRDWKVGYLITNNTIYVVSKGFGSSKPAFMFYGMTIGRTKYSPLVMTRRQKANVFLASTIHDLPMDIWQNISENYEFVNLSAGYADEVVRNSIADGAGDLRNLLTMILFLYQNQEVIHVNQVAPHRGILKGRAITYMAHSVVTIHLNEIKKIRKHFETHDRGSPRRHEVRPFYRTVPKNKSCDHLWVPYESDRWECKRCGSKRARIKGYQRGDATKGYVMKHYEVTK
jgi:hypothetical protein